MRNLEFSSPENTQELARDSKSETIKFIESVRRISEFVRSNNVSNIMFLDKKGRIAAAFFLAVWKQETANESLPKITFMNVHNTMRYKVPGYEDIKDQTKNIENYQAIIENDTQMIDLGKEKLGVDAGQLQEIAKGVVDGIKAEFKTEYPELFSAIEQGERVLVIDEIVNTGDSVKVCKDILSLVGPDDQIMVGGVWAYGDENMDRKVKLDVVGSFRPDIPIPNQNGQLDPLFSFLDIRTSQDKLNKLGIADTPHEFSDERDRDFIPLGFQSTLYPSDKSVEFRHKINDLVNNYYSE